MAMTDDELGDLIRRLGPDPVPLPRPDPRQGPAAIPSLSYQDMYNPPFTEQEMLDLLGSAQDENEPTVPMDPRLRRGPYFRPRRSPNESESEI